MSSHKLLQKYVKAADKLDLTTEQKIRFLKAKKRKEQQKLLRQFQEENDRARADGAMSRRRKRSEKFRRNVGSLLAVGALLLAMGYQTRSIKKLGELLRDIRDNKGYTNGWIQPGEESHTNTTADGQQGSQSSSSGEGVVNLAPQEGVVSLAPQEGVVSLAPQDDARQNIAPRDAPHNADFLRGIVDGAAQMREQRVARQDDALQNIAHRAVPQGAPQGAAFLRGITDGAAEMRDRRAARQDDALQNIAHRAVPQGAPQGADFLRGIANKATQMREQRAARQDDALQNIAPRAVQNQGVNAAVEEIARRAHRKKPKSVVRIQALQRARSARKQMEKYKQARASASARIQARQRGYTQKKKYKQARASSIKIQSLLRKRNLRKRVATIKRKRDERAARKAPQPEIFPDGLGLE